MKGARLVVLGIAVAAGGIAAMLASSGKKVEAPPPPAAPALETVDVLIAKDNLARGEVIQGQNIGWQVWPAAVVNSSFIKKSDRPDALNQFIGAIVRVPTAAGQPIFDPMVVFAKGSGFLAAVLPKGMRAVAMEISPENGAGGFILPEDHVDVLLSRRDAGADKGGAQKFATETILRNVRVLAVDQAVDEKDGQKVAVGKTVTVELTPPQAQTLLQARQSGSLALALRSLVDSQSDMPEGGDDNTGDHKGTINMVRYGVSSIAAAH